MITDIIAERLRIHFAYESEIADRESDVVVLVDASSRIRSLMKKLEEQHSLIARATGNLQESLLDAEIKRQDFAHIQMLADNLSRIYLSHDPDTIAYVLDGFDLTDFKAGVSLVPDERLQDLIKIMVDELGKRKR